MEKGAHKDPIIDVFYLSDEIMGSASLDGDVRFWDLRAPEPLSTLPLEKGNLWKAKSGGDVLVYLTSENQVLRYSISDVFHGRPWE